MNLTRKEVEILNYLMRNKANFKDVALSLEIKKPNLTNYIKKLERYHLVTVTRKGQTKELSLEYALWFGFFGVKKKLPYIKLTDLLVGTTPFLLSFIKTKSNFKISD